MMADASKRFSPFTVPDYLPVWADRDCRRLCPPFSGRRFHRFDTSAAIALDCAASLKAYDLVPFFHQHDHELSIPSALGRYCGSEPLAKSSMTIIRLPQDGQQRSGASGFCAFAASVWLGCSGGSGAQSSSLARATLAARLPLANSP